MDGEGIRVGGADTLGHIAQACARGDGDGATANAYAPFYLWSTVAGMDAFLWGDGFEAGGEGWLTLQDLVPRRIVARLFTSIEEAGYRTVEG